MPKHSTKKSGYCPNCTKNVPHFRSPVGPLSELIERLMGRVLAKMRIGPWYCLHCQKSSFWLPAHRERAPNYQMIDPLDFKVPEDSGTWTKSSVRRKAQAAAKRETQQTAPESTVKTGPDETTGNDSSVKDSVSSDELVESNSPTLQKITADSVILGGEKKFDSCASDEEVDYASIGLESSDEIESLMRIDRMAKPKNTDLPEAESVGNFIKDRSLLLQSTRMHRVSVKYRDSVVKRILSGQVSISQLTSAGEYTEGELISWIADLVKRLNQRVDLLQESLGQDWGDESHLEEFGPKGPR